MDRCLYCGARSWTDGYYCSFECYKADRWDRLVQKERKEAQEGTDWDQMAQDQAELVDGSMY